jgi:hypothetical protein
MIELNVILTFLFHDTSKPKDKDSKKAAGTIFSHQGPRKARSNGLSMPLSVGQNSRIIQSRKGRHAA